MTTRNIFDSWLRVRSIATVLLLSWAATFAGRAALLNNPQAFPSVGFRATRGNTYNHTTQVFKAAGSGASLTLSLTSSDAPLSITSDPLGWSFQIAILVNNSGVLTPGVPSGFTDNLKLIGQVDLTSRGLGIRNGVLLTGSVSGFGYLDTGAPNDNFDMLFTITGGSLADLFPVKEIVVINTCEGSTFANNFNVDFSGTSKGSFGPLQSLGDYVWVDSNANGLQDTGETGLNGVTVNLYDSALTLLKTTTTANDSNGRPGYYLFRAVGAGGYVVEVIKPDGYVFSPQNAVGSATNSDVDRSTGRTGTITLPLSTVDLTWDAGLVPAASLGDYVWVDANDNGIQDGGETGLNGVTVNLRDAANNVLATTSTTTGGPGGAPGYYEFTGLLPGSYVVEFIEPSGYTLSLKNQGSNDALDSDADRLSGKTDTITLVAGQHDTTQDAGMVPLNVLSSLGDFVWVDENGNGIQDAGEPGLDGVTVVLYDCAGNPLSTNVTATVGGQPGYYLFPELDPGCYVVKFIKPAGYVFSPRGQGTNRETDSDADVGTGLTAQINLALGQSDMSWDAGLVPEGQLASLGDRVWEDTNGNGIQEAGEPGINNVAVNLYDCAGHLLGTTFTAPGGAGNADGFYQFPGLYPGCYVVEFVRPPGYLFTLQNQGGNTALDSDVDRTTGRTASITLVPGQNNVDIDAGMVPPSSLASVGDYVWQDNNGNGIQELGEPGISGVTVNLYDCANHAIGTTSTDINGRYEFKDLLPGCYVVEFIKPAAFVFFSPVNQGTDDSLDSDADSATGRTPAITLAPGGHSLIWDAGMVPTSALAAIGDFVWLDANGNGVQDVSELGIGGVTVRLYDCGNNPVASTVTSANGLYQFSGLLPGCYYLQFVNPGGLVFTAPDQGTDDLDSDASQVNGVTTSTITLGPGQVDSTWDAGLYAPAALGDYVWEDLNGNGVQDAGETGLDNVTVNLYDCAGKSVATAVTANGGHYLFSSLAPGCYKVEFVPPVGYVFSPKNKGGDATLDSDADTTSGLTGPVTLASGENNLTVDAGLYASVTIGDFVWNDANANGIQDAGELGISGVTVTLSGTDGSGNPVTATTTTDASGHYSFTEPPGTYTVAVTTPSGYAPTPTGKGTPATDSNPSPSATTPVVLPSGGSDLTIDFGFYQPVTIGDFVWNDANGNGVQDGSEPGIPGVTVNLTGTDAAGNSVTAATTTDASGHYLFTQPPGTYTVAVVTPAGYTPTGTGKGTTATDSNSSPSGTTPVALAEGGSDLTIDFGFYQPVTIGNFVWNDANANGIQDAGEPGISGVTVTLSGTDGLGNPVTATTTTDANGHYSFTEPPGTYTVAVTTPSGYTPTATGKGTAGTNSDPSPSGTTPVAMPSGSSDPTIDFGFYQPATIGDFVWNDANGNGIQDAGEPGISGVSLKLTGVDAAGNSVSAGTTTDASGHYLFTEPPGTYTVRVHTPAGYVPTATGKGTLATADSNPNPSGTAPAALPEGGSDLTIDFGFYQPVTIGDMVWNDANANGIQDAGELGIVGVTVTLSGTDGLGNQVTATTTTDANGQYLFTEPPGTYLVSVVTPAGYAPTATGKGTPATDSNPSPSGTTPVALPSGGSDLTIDFGYYQPVRIGNYVWNDANANGIQDGDELGIAGVTLTLTGTTVGGVAVTDHATTASDGSYLFTELPGTYIVMVDAGNASGALAGYAPTATGQGTTATDSNPSPSGTTPVLLPAGGSDLTIDFGYHQIPQGCTLTIGYYKNHSAAIQPLPIYLGNIGGAKSLKVDTQQKGVDVLSQNVYGKPSNGITKLYAQLLAAKLNILSGADQSVVVGVIAQADAFLATHDQTAWSGCGSAEQTFVLAWHTALDSYNNGFTGPGHCGDTVQVQASISGTVWRDCNADSTIDVGGPGLAGVTVTLKDTSGTVVATTLTDANGAYTFGNLTAGAYTVIVTAPANYTQTSDPDATKDNKTVVTLTADQVLTDVSFGYTGTAPAIAIVKTGPTTAKVGDTITYHFKVTDTGNTCFNGGVTVDDPMLGGRIFSKSSVAPGEVMEFDVTYVVKSSDPNPLVNTATATGHPPIGAAVTAQSTWTVTLTSAALSSLSGYVYLDKDNDGVKETGEAGIASVKITLSGKDSAGNAVSMTTTTDANGYYQFTNLPAGTYTITETQPTGYQDGKDTQGTPGTGTAGNDVFSTIALAAGVNGVNNNFGELISLSGYTTYTQGGWGATPNGSNPGAILANSFASIYPSGVVIGGTKTAKFTSAKAIENFLPASGTPSVLTGSSQNPTSTAAGVFAGQVLALRLSVDFSNAGKTKVGLASLKVASGGKLVGWTVAQVLDLANKVLGGNTGALPAGCSISDLNNVVDKINNNFDGGTQNLGFLVP